MHSHPPGSPPLLTGCDFAQAGYRMLRRDGRPLLLLPPAPAAAALTLGLYLPQTAKARVAVSALRLANRLGLLGVVLPSASPPTDDATPSDHAKPFTQADLDAGRIGVLLCNPSHGGGRFIAVRAGDAPSIVKGAARPQAASLEQERAVIGRLAALGLPGVPSVLSDGGDAISYWFEMPHYARAEVKSVADIRAIRLLESWTGGETVNPLEAEPLRSIVAASGAQTLGLGGLERLSSLRIRRAAMHGDFAPWNLRKGAEGLVAIDWEWGRRDGLAGLDLGYGLLQEALLVKKLPPPAALRFVRRVAETPACAVYLKEAGWGGALDLWLAVGAWYRHSRSPSPALLAAAGFILNPALGGR